MTEQTFQPGDIVSAYVITRSKRHVLVYVGKVLNGIWPWRLLDSTSDPKNAGIGTTNLRDVKILFPALNDLVRIDPEDAEQVERLLTIYNRGTYPEQEPAWVEAMQAALREFARPKPPKPDEPKGLAALVEDSQGEHWVRLSPAGADATNDDWKKAGYHGLETDEKWFRYKDLDVVRVIYPGHGDPQ